MDYIWSLNLFRRGVRVCWRVIGLHLINLISLIKPVQAGVGICMDYIWSLTLFMQGVGFCWRMYGLHLELNPAHVGSLLEDAQPYTGKGRGN